jgi:hypothetical protein
MVERIAALGKPRNLIPLIAVLAAATFNNWLLAPLFNYHLFASNGSVSEFSAVDQPYYLVFRTLDVFSGLLFVLLALLLAQFLKQKDRWRHVLILGLAVLGIANIMDAVFTLPCSETLDKACKVPINVSLRHLEIPSHGYSSTIIAICYFLLPLAGIIYGRAREFKYLTVFSVIAALVALFSFGSAIAEYANEQAFSVRTSGISQEAQMIVMGIWLATWAFDVCKPKIRGKPQIT